VVDFVEIYFGKMVIKDTKRIFNSDKICHSYSDLNIGVTFFGTQCILVLLLLLLLMTIYCHYKYCQKLGHISTQTQQEQYS